MTKISNQYSLTNVLFADAVNGRVGIGTTSPTVPLDVVGAGKFSGALTGTSATFSSSVTATQATFTATANTYAGGALILKAFGGTNPIYLTSVSGYFALSNGGGADHLLIASTGAATFSSSVLAQSDVESYNQFVISGGQLRIVNNGGQVGMNWTSGSNGDLYFRTASSERMRITSAGNVGIGTTGSPWDLFTALDIGTNAALANYTLYTVLASNVYYASSGNWTFKTTGYGSALYMRKDDGSIYFSTFGTGSAGATATGSERMRITSAYPTILVGTSNNTWGEANRASIELNGTTTSLVGFLSGGTQKGYIYNNGTDIIGQLNSGGAWQFKSSGGGVQLTFNSTAWASISDERLKNINSYINDAVSKLNTLRTINYSWKSDATQQEFLGLIAQDVDKVFPEVIERNKKPENIGEVKDETIYLSVKYTELVPVLIKAIQELSAQASEQQLQINELKALLNAH